MCGCDACKQARARAQHSLAEQTYLRLHPLGIRTLHAYQWCSGERVEGKPNECDVNSSYIVYLNLLFNKKSVKSQQCLAQYIKCGYSSSGSIAIYTYG